MRTFHSSIKSAFFNNMTNNILHWWNGSQWYDILKSFKGNESNKPTLTLEQEGALMYDITSKKYIMWNGTAWVNLDGTALI